ncbi:hypothetical protein SMA5143A_8226 [Streptomyces sp. MA5143a]|nr:hypothetical protein SMA5143A_8226 [Streptomyces sp. MA5143a]
MLAEHGDSPEDPIPIAIETSRGHLVTCLQASGRRVYAINPMTVARYRHRHVVSAVRGGCPGVKAGAWCGRRRRRTTSAAATAGRQRAIHGPFNAPPGLSAPGVCGSHLGGLSHRRGGTWNRGSRRSAPFRRLLPVPPAVPGSPCGDRSPGGRDARTSTPRAWPSVERVRARGSQTAVRPWMAAVSAPSTTPTGPLPGGTPPTRRSPARRTSAPAADRRAPQEPPSRLGREVSPSGAAWSPG